MRTKFEELCSEHQELADALNALDRNQEVLEGFPEYEDDKMEEFIMGYTDSTTRLEEEADVVIRVMIDLFSPFTVYAPSPGLDGMTDLLTSEE